MKIRPIYLVFFMNSMVLGNWIPRIPDVKRLLGFSDTMLGLCLLVLAVGTLTAFSLGGRFVHSVGLRKACCVAMPVWALAFVPAVLTDFTIVFALALYVAGLGVGVLEIAMNTKADEIEQAEDVRIMSRCHGFWSLGSLFGALMGAWLADAGVDITTHFLVVMPILGAIGFGASSMLQESPAKIRKERSEPASFTIPTLVLLPLCLMPVGVMLVEGAFIDWSAIFVKEELSGGPLAIGLIYAVFSSIMAATRFSGDWFRARFGPVKVALVSAIAATLGIVSFALSTSVPVAFAGAALCGLGVAIVYPLAMTAVARHPSGNPTDNVAALSFTAFAAFMIAPPIIGFLSDQLSLWVALLCLAPFTATSILLAPRVEPAREVAHS